MVFALFELEDACEKKTKRTKGFIFIITTRARALKIT